jgi:hypothetical protein
MMRISVRLVACRSRGGLQQSLGDCVASALTAWPAAAKHLGTAFGWAGPGMRGLSASYCLSYTITLVESGWPLADTPFDVTVMVLPSADSVFVPV